MVMPTVLSEVNCESKKVDPFLRQLLLKLQDPERVVSSQADVPHVRVLAHSP